jgi:predicted RNA-binding Zn-ribbon protein involved in translation (DUF1610 family)
MSRQTKSTKPSRNIPEHIKRAVNAREHHICQSCGVHTEFIHYDHKFPFDLGGPTTVENIQSLCPKCNTSKGNKIQCHHCRHWMSPDNAKCPQCGTKFPYSKRNQTLAGKLELLFEKVGRAVVIGGAALILILFLTGGFYVYRRLSGSSQMADHAAHVETIVNKSFDVAATQPTSFQVVVPVGAKNARLVGGYKVTSGDSVNCYVLDAIQFQTAMGGAKDFPSMIAKEKLNSARVRQMLNPGTYYLYFAPDAATTKLATVAAEFYLKFD